MHTGKDRNISVVFRPQDVRKHCAGVEALLTPSIPSHKILFTASRDSTVKRWDVSGPEPVLEASFEGHSGWVNDLALIGDLLITCSNDHTVRLWRAGSDNGRLLHTLAAHSDYVTRLAAAPDRRLVVSAGLRAEVFSYDVEVGVHTRILLRGHSAGFDGEGVQVHDDPCSVYSLALSPSARLLAAGTSESLVRLLDPRTGSSVGKLRGHRDVVRALAVNSSGTKLISGASDGAIKLWDVGMRRCVQTFHAHTDSVWSLLVPDDSLSHVYSAGRDRAIFRTSTNSCVSELLAMEQQPVRALAVDLDARPPPSGGFGSGRVGLWAGTLDSHVNMWLVPAPGVRQLQEVASVPASRPATSPSSTDMTAVKCASAGGAAGGATTVSTGVIGSASDAAASAFPSAACTGAGGKPATASNAVAAAAASAFAMRPVSDVPLLQSGKSFPALRVSSTAAVSRVEPLARKPVVTIPGVPAIVEHEVLADRRRILTRDSRGYVALWDVLLGTEMVLYGKADFDAKRRELWEARSVPPWFTCDHRLGCLSITLNASTAFSAEEYAVNVGFGDVPEDHKINCGKLVLECVFAKWRFMLERRRGALGSPGISPSSSSGGGNVYCSVIDPRLQRGSSAGDGCGGGAQPPTVPALVPARGRGGGSSSGGGGAEDDRQYYTELWPKYWQIGAVPAVMGERSDGQRWRRLLTSFDGSENEPDEIPAWVADVVLRSASVAPLTAKVTFYLLPVKGSNLPTLSITRLQAPHILEAHKVAKYCCDKLQEHGIQLEVLPGHRRRAPLAPLLTVVAGAGAAPQQCLPFRVLELTCNGLAVPYDMNLAAIKKFLWQEHDDLTFHYGLRDPANPAPQPRLVPSC